MIVELGGGTRPYPWSDVVIDIRHPRRAPAQDVTVVPWMSDDGVIESGSVDRVVASHLLEHVPSGDPRIAVFNEAWRVLRSGGTFDIIVPLVGYSEPGTGRPMTDGVGWQPWSDPTHVSYWWFPESLMYFANGPFKPNADYGISIWQDLRGWCTDPFNEVDGGWTVAMGWEGRARMVKP